MDNIDKIKDKVQKLINQADDRAGHPDANAYLAKAAELMARYGFEERDLNQADEGDEVISQTFTFSGTYTDMQARLLFGLMEALHCKGFGNRRRNSTKFTKVTMFGKRRHIERVAMLFPILNASMAVQSQHRDLNELIGTSTVTQRRSFMLGFISTIAQRLEEMESTVADNTDERERYAVALVDDAAAAQNALDEHMAGQKLRTIKTNNKIDPSAMRRGHSAANRADLGQARVGGARAALTS